MSEIASSSLFYSIEANMVEITFYEGLAQRRLDINKSHVMLSALCVVRAPSAAF